MVWNGIEWLSFGRYFLVLKIGGVAGERGDFIGKVSGVLELSIFQQEIFNFKHNGAGFISGKC